MTPRESELNKISRLVARYLKQKLLSKGQIDYFKENKIFPKGISDEIVKKLGIVKPEKVIEAVDALPMGYTNENISRDYFLSCPMETYEFPKKSLKNFALTHLTELPEDYIEDFLEMQRDILGYNEEHPLHCSEELLRRIVNKNTGSFLGILGENGELLGCIILSWFSLDEDYMRKYLNISKKESQKIIRIQKLIAKPGHEDLKDLIFKEACDYAFSLDAACIYGYFGSNNGARKRRILMEEGCKNTTKRSIRQRKGERVLFILK